jgi:uncharacterized integral membrane protein (TIGR00697 family)
MGALVVADVTSVKLIGFTVPWISFDILFPVGTIAFAATFLATDIVGELFSKRHAIFIVWMGVVLRILVMFYFLAAVGAPDGSVLGLAAPPFWSPENQASYGFVLGGTFWIYIGGFAAILISSLADVFIFHHFKEKHAGKNLFWFRNNFSTIFGQIINSTVFISIAFAGTLTIAQILSAIFGQFLIKTGLAFLDTPVAYLIRNYGNGSQDWYRFWTKAFWKG